MKRKMFLLVFAAFAACTQMPAQSTASQKWVGVWHAVVDVQRPDTLTLAADTGKLQGTIVLDMLSREGGVTHVVERQTHLLLNPHLGRNTLSFQVQMKLRDGRVVLHSFEAKMMAPGKAELHCEDCGPNAPTVLMIKQK